MTVGDLKEMCDDILYVLQNYDDDLKIRLSANTYGIGHDFIASYEGFLPISQIEDRIETGDDDEISDSRRRHVRDNVYQSDHSNNNLVGCQKFTYGELEKAIEKMFDNVNSDPDNLPKYEYDIRNGYSLQSDNDPEYGYNHEWDDYRFDMKSIISMIENIPDEISHGDMEVYFDDFEEGYAESDEHGIIFEDGQISHVY